MTATDWVIPNILFLYHTPSVPGYQQADLDSLKAEIVSWNQWELGHVEREIDRMIEEGKLPADRSLESRVRRTNVRCLFLEDTRLKPEW